MKCLSILVLIFLPLLLFAQDVTVGPGGDYNTLALAGPNLLPGDSVMVFDGVYVNGTQFLNGVNGNANLPIYIYSQTQHGAIFRGGTEAIHLVDCNHMILDGFAIENQTGNGINIDDGGNYNTPTKHIEVKNCLFQDMLTPGNNDFLKLSGLDSFHIHHCVFRNGSGGGSGIDMVGCHWGVIEDNIMDDAGVSGIQAKGGTQHVVIQRNIFKDMDQRAINLGGSTGLQFFRPPLGNPIMNAFEAADLEVYSNVFYRSWAPIAYVGCVNVSVCNNTFFKPENWVIRILQETTTPGFLPCSNNEFRNNIIYLESDLTEVNIGPNTLPNTFSFSNNLWFNEQSNNWTPVLPVVDLNQIVINPMFKDTLNEDLDINSASMAVGSGIYLANVVTDFDQNFYLDTPSIGAYEGDASTELAAMEIQTDTLVLLANPSNINFKIEGNLSQATIQVLDLNGQLHTDYSASSSPLVIDTSLLPSGLFFLYVAQNNNQLIKLEQIIKF